jgi:Protein of unknown function (DUF1214)
VPSSWKASAGRLLGSLGTARSTSLRGKQHWEHAFKLSSYPMQTPGPKIDLPCEKVNSRQQRRHRAGVTRTVARISRHPAEIGALKEPEHGDRSVGLVHSAVCRGAVTMYEGKTQLLIENPIDRYLINSPMLPDLRRNPDGSLTI